ncbi:ornithine carbamoyltransferase [cyanobiont of Ornithocercus magnificus]|nr:ornithine carbamoyltransferase [cyanobiont of Ornithocercus magnificus]
MAATSTDVAASLRTLKGRNFLSSSDLDSAEIRALLELAGQLKRGDRHIELSNRVLGLLFTKPSTRTRVSFQVAMARLGGQTVDLNPQVTQISRGESLQDTACVLSRFCDALAVRAFTQQEVADYAMWSSIPVLNALTDLEHPCQALADYLTIKENFGELNGQTLAYLGDGNNVAHSLMLCGAVLGVNVHIGCPEGFEPLPAVLKQARALATSSARVEIFHEPTAAARGAQVLYTDTWTSMGQEQEEAKRELAFQGFCLDEVLLKEADPAAIVLHCLPAHRGKEISAAVIESPASRIFDQAENRLHTQQALLAAVMGGLC